MVTDRMTIRRTEDVVNGVVDRMWAAECPCEPGTVMRMRCISSKATFAWVRKHLDRYHPREAA